tara:strand:- start:378 stop:596 length:219 start_codon:yes stop_codon:yes gene_type:complete
MFKEVADNFSAEVEQNVHKYDGSYIDTILGLCDEHEIEPALVSKHLTKPIIEKIESEGISFNLLPAKSKLPI